MGVWHVWRTGDVRYYLCELCFYWVIERGCRLLRLFNVGSVTKCNGAENFVPEVSGRTLRQYHFFQQKSDVAWAEVDPEPTL
jgi:hypothetical protein